MRWPAVILVPVLVAGVAGCGQSAEETMSNAERDFGISALTASVSLACLAYDTAGETIRSGKAPNMAAVRAARAKAEKSAEDAARDLVTKLGKDPEATYTVDGQERTATLILDEAEAKACEPARFVISGLRELGASAGS